jgi:signal transduction histidine kinase
MVDLMPPRLAERGLSTALRQYAEQFEQRTGIRTRFSRKGLDCRLPAALESCLYRVAQEALTNVWKHSEARTARVGLDVNRRTCLLRISDDGKGFNPDSAPGLEREHLGLGSLRDRAELVGGRFSITCVPGRGTTVQVSAPLAD